MKLAVINHIKTVKRHIKERRQIACWWRCLELQRPDRRYCLRRFTLLWYASIQCWIRFH